METKVLPGRYTLTQEERAAKSIELAELIQQLPLKEENLSHIQKTLKADIEGIKSSIQALSRIVRDGWEMRDQECTLMKDYQRKRRQWISVDTGEVLMEEHFREGDIQMRLGDEAA